MYMTSEEIRKRFLDFFVEHGHKAVPSSSLIPADPSVLLTTAGMQQFKPYYTGELDVVRDFKSHNVVSIQKCFRTGDIDEVGDATHNTFFEMLGNFSFGGYFKKEAITFAYEVFTEQLDMPISYVTIFKGSGVVPKDEESRAIWKSLGVKDIREQGMEDVFWGPTGTAGPCGPTTEIYCKNSEGKDVEVWNIVFNEFSYPGSREELLKGISNKVLQPLPIKGIDTGAGLERITMTKQGVASIYETDLFAGLIAAIAATAPHLPVRERRIMADHIRAAVFLIADGVRPSNKEAGYILRRLLRRLLAYKIRYDIHANLFAVLIPLVRKQYGVFYPEVLNTEIVRVMEEEQEKFERAVASGLVELKKHTILTASEAFSISSTFGLGFELMKDMAPDSLQGVNSKEFEAEFKKHQEISKAGSEKKFGGHGLLLDTGELKAKDEEELKKVTRLHTATHLLQQALRLVLGGEVSQAGSDITVERTRFDFRFSRKLTPAEIKKVEEIVNDVVAKDLPVAFVEMAKTDAEKTGALFFFKQKYPEQVKVYYVGHSLSDAFSKEFCGGPHVDHTGIIGKFKIVKEEAVGAGTRRIRAIVE